MLKKIGREQPRYRCRFCCEPNAFSQNHEIQTHPPRVGYLTSRPVFRRTREIRTRVQIPAIRTRTPFVKRIFYNARVMCYLHDNYIYGGNCYYRRCTCCRRRFSLEADVHSQRRARLRAPKTGHDSPPLGQSPIRVRRSLSDGFPTEIQLRFVEYRFLPGGSLRTLRVPNMPEQYK